MTSAAAQLPSPPLGAPGTLGSGPAVGAAAGPVGMACSAVPPLATSAHGPAVSPVLATAVQLQQTYNQTGEAGQVRAQDPPDPGFVLQGPLPPKPPAVSSCARQNLNRNKTLGRMGSTCRQGPWGAEGPYRTLKGPRGPCRAL